MIAVEINNAQQIANIDLERLERVSEATLREEGVKSAEVSVAIIDSDTMQRLNREHLGHDYDTDVLSFLFDSDEDESASADLPRGRGKSIDGEVLIGAGTAARVAKEFGWSVEDEVILYLVHGLLHLVGYDDLTETEKTLMRQREIFHLAQWGLTPTYEEGDMSAQKSENNEPVFPGPSSGVRG